MSDAAGPSEQFRLFAESVRARAPFYATLSTAIADHPHVADLLLSASVRQRQPALLLAALHDQVLADPGCELAAWYPTATTNPRHDAVDGALVRHCARFGDAIRATLATRATQTNEVGRCGLLVPALGIIARDHASLALVDVGTSAGLNLRLDHYGYRYEPGGRVGGPSRVEITTGTRGPVPVPARPPNVVRRVGIDRSPIDIGVAADARWLEACVWPDQRDRFERLAGALAIADEVPIEVRVGDAVDEVGAAVADVAVDGLPVVINTWVLSYLSEHDRRRYVAELDRVGGTVDLAWVFAESPAQCPGLPFPDAIAAEHVTALELVRWRGGERAHTHLGVAHPHGYWLHWHDA